MAKMTLREAQELSQMARGALACSRSKWWGGEETAQKSIRVEKIVNTLILICNAGAEAAMVEIPNDLLRTLEYNVEQKSKKPTEDN